jgi:hypothetical protein
MIKLVSVTHVVMTLPMNPETAAVFKISSFAPSCFRSDNEVTKQLIRLLRDDCRTFASRRVKASAKRRAFRRESGISTSKRVFPSEVQDISMEGIAERFCSVLVMLVMREWTRKLSGDDSLVVLGIGVLVMLETKRA